MPNDELIVIHKKVRELHGFLGKGEGRERGLTRERGKSRCTTGFSLHLGIFPIYMAGVFSKMPNCLYRIPFLARPVTKTWEIRFSGDVSVCFPSQGLPKDSTGLPVRGWPQSIGWMEIEPPEVWASIFLPPPLIEP